MRKYKRLIKKTAAVLGAGIAVGTVGILPVVGPVTNVYAASSYESAQSEYETRLAEAKKTKNLTVNETEETVTVYASQAEAKKVELQSKIEAETAKLETAISTQRSRNSQAEADNKNPEKVLATWAGQDVNAYTKNQLIEFLTNTSGEFDVNKLEDLDFSKATGFSTTAKLVSDYELDQCINCSATPEIRKEYFRTMKANNQRVRAGGDPFSISNVYIPEVGAKFREKGLMEKGDIDAIFTITSFETLEKSLSPMLEWCPTEGFAITGGLKTITFKVDFVKSGTETPVTIDVGYRSTDIDGRGSYTNDLDGTQRGANNIKPVWISGEATTVTPPDKASYGQAVTLYSPYKTLLSRGTNVVVESGQTAIGMAAGVDDDDFDASCGFIYRDVTSFSLKWDCDIASSTKIGNTAIDENNYPNAMLNSFRNRQGVYPAIYVRPDSGELTGSTNAWIGFKGLDLKYKTFKATPSSVSVKTYNLVVEPDPQTPQKGSVDFKDKAGRTIADKKVLSGLSGNPFNYSPELTIIDLYHKGYDLVSNDYPAKESDQVFDDDSSTDQNFHVVMTPHIEKITIEDPKTAGSSTNRRDVTYPEGLARDDLSKTVTRTIRYVYEDGTTAFETKTQPVTLTRDATFNYVTGEVTYSAWTTGSWAKVDSPTRENYTVDKASVAQQDVTSATKDTTIVVTYSKTPQKGSVKFVDDKGTEIATKKVLSGYSAEPFNYSPSSTIINLISSGYDLKSDNFPYTNPKFDTDSSKDQDYTIVFTPHKETITPDDPKTKGTSTDRPGVTYPAGLTKNDLSKTVTRTIKYVYEDGTPAHETVTQTVTLTRNGTFDYVAGTVTYTPWTTDTFDKVNSPVIPNYVYDKSMVNAANVTSTTADSTITVTYTRIPQKGSVKFVDTTGKEIATKKTLNGYNEEPFNYSPNNTISDLESNGWDVVSNNFPYDNPTYDTDSSKDQDYVIVFTPHVETIKPNRPKNEGDQTDRANVDYPGGINTNDLNKTITRTIKYVYEDGTTAFNPVEQEVVLTREATFNYVTGKVTYGAWTTGSWAKVDSPTKPNYSVDKASVAQQGVTNTTSDTTVIVTYKKIPQKGSVKFVDTTGEELAAKKTLSGYNEEPFNYSPSETKNTLINKGYDLVSDNFPYTNPRFDTDSSKDQDYTLIFTPHIEKVTSEDPKTKGSSTDRTDVSYPGGLTKAELSKTVTRTIKYVYEDGTTAFETKTQPVTLTREAKFNYVTGAVTYGAWTTGSWAKVDSPTKPNYSVDKASVAQQGVTNTTSDTTVVVTYKKIPQKGSVKFVDDKGKEIATKKVLTGYNTEPFNYTPSDTINALKNKGYDLISDNFPYNNPYYDTDSSKDQDYTIVFTPHIETITPDNPKSKGDETPREEVTYPAGLTKDDLNKTVTRTIKYVYEDGTTAFETKTQPVTLTREATVNYVTGEVSYKPWTTGMFNYVASPIKQDYTPNRTYVPSETVTDKSKDSTVVIIYAKNKQKGSVNFVDKDGKAVAAPKVLEGYNKEPFNYSPLSTINDLKAKGYDLVSDNFPYDNPSFDTDYQKDQDYTIVFTPHVEEIKPNNPKNPGDETNRDGITYPEGLTKDDLNKTVTRTIKYQYTNGSTAAETKVQSVTLERTATFNYVTRKVTYSPWTTGTFEQVKSPVIENYVYDKSVVDESLVKSSTADSTILVTYSRIPQNGSVRFVDTSGKDIAPKKELSGYNNEPFNYTPAKTISELEKDGWNVVGNNFPYDNTSFDSDPDTDQNYTITFAPKQETITPDNPKKPGEATDRSNVTYPKGLTKDDLSKTVTRTIKYVYEDGKEAAPTVVQKVELKRTAVFDYVTGKVTYSDWTTSDMKEVVSPEIKNYSRDIDKVKAKKATVEDRDEEIVVTYKKTPQRASITFKDDGGKEIADKVVLDGFNEEPFNYTPDATISDLEKIGYDLISNDFPIETKDRTFDTDSGKDQDYTVVFTPHIEKVTAESPKDPGTDTGRSGIKYPEGLKGEDLQKTFTRTIKYVYEDGRIAFETKIQAVTVTREAYFNYVTGKIAYGNWSVKGVEAVESPVLEGYTADKQKVIALDALTENIEVVVTYTAKQGGKDTTTKTNAPEGTKTPSENGTPSGTDTPEKDKTPSETDNDPGTGTPAQGSDDNSTLDGPGTASNTTKVGNVDTGDKNGTPFIVTALAAVGGVIGAAIGINKKRKKD